MEKQNIMDEDSERIEKYMRRLWGLSDSGDDDDDDHNDAGDNVKRSGDDQNYGNAKMDHSKNKVKKMELNKKRSKIEKLDMHNDELVKTKGTSFGRNMLKRKKSNEMKDTDVKKYSKKKGRKNEKMSKRTIDSTRENSVSVSEIKKKTETETKVDTEAKTESETETKNIKGKEDIPKNLQNSGSKDNNTVGRKNTYKEKKESAFFRDTKLEKQEHWKDKFGTISNIQSKLIKNKNINIMSSPKEKEKKIGKGIEKKVNDKKSSTKNDKLTKREITDIRNILKEREEFKNIVREVRNVAKQHLNKFQKLILLNHEIRELGGKFDKSRKMPYPELICRKRAMKKYIKERKEMERHAGVKFQSGDYTDMQDVFRKKKKEKKKKRQKSSKLLGI